MQRLQVPAVAHQFARQPIEKFGVRRRFTGLSKITRRANEAFTKMMLPDAIHHHARSEGIRVRSDPFSEAFAAHARSGSRRRGGEGPLASRRDRERSRLHNRAFLSDAAVMEEVGFRRNGAGLLDDRHCGFDVRAAQVEKREFLTKLTGLLPFLLGKNRFDFAATDAESFFNLQRDEPLAFRAFVGGRVERAMRT